MGKSLGLIRIFLLKNPYLTSSNMETVQFGIQELVDPRIFLELSDSDEKNICC